MMAVALKIFLGLSFCVFGAQACNDEAIRTCTSTYFVNSECGSYDAVAYGDCLDNAGIDQCPPENLNANSSRSVTLSCEGQICGMALNLCVTNITQEVTADAQQLFQNLGPQSQGTLLCMCENPDSTSDKYVKQFNDCLDNSEYKNCVQKVKDELDPIVMNFTKSIRATIAPEEICNQATMRTAGDCDCAMRGDMCVETYMGGDFNNKSASLLSSDNGESFLQPPQCLELGTEQKFKDAYKCLLDLPDKCGYKDFNLLAFIDAQNGDGDNMQNAPKVPSQYLVATLAMSCRQACVDITSETSSLDACLTAQGIDTNMNLTDVQALQGVAKTEFCAKLRLVAPCVGMKVSACPIVAKNVQLILNNATAGMDTEANDDMPISLGMYSACDIKLGDFITDEFAEDDISGSTDFRAQPHAALLMALLASVFKWML